MPWAPAAAAWRRLQDVANSSWVARWAPGEELRALAPPRHADFRDALPPPLEVVVVAYAPVVAAREGRWVVGLFDMWSPKVRLVINSKHERCLFT